MKLLIDQNVSHRTLPLHFSSGSIEWTHVKESKLSEATDEQIWAYALATGMECIVSADQDFYQILLMKGIPPKLIWLRIGNGSYQRLAAILNANQGSILSFLSDPKAECLEIWP